jgi:transcriptional regulator with XRE-family HTH domain
MTFGEQLRAARVDRGMTRGALALRSGVSYRTLQRLETTPQGPSDAVLIRLADALELPRSVLREWDSRS